MQKMAPHGLTYNLNLDFITRAVELEVHPQQANTRQVVTVTSHTPII